MQKLKKLLTGRVLFFLMLIFVCLSTFSLNTRVGDADVTHSAEAAPTPSDEYDTADLRKPLTDKDTSSSYPTPAAVPPDIKDSNQDNKMDNKIYKENASRTVLTPDKGLEGNNMIPTYKDKNGVKKVEPTNGAKIPSAEEIKKLMLGTNAAKNPAYTKDVPEVDLDIYMGGKGNDKTIQDTSTNNIPATKADNPTVASKNIPTSANPTIARPTAPPTAARPPAPPTTARPATVGPTTPQPTNARPTLKPRPTYKPPTRPTPKLSRNHVGDHTALMKTIYSNYTKNISFAAVDADKANQQVLPYKKAFIYSMPRSGSTFMGNLFKNTNDIVYMFEVFAHFKLQDGCADSTASLDNLHVGDLVKEMYTCDFENIVKLQNVNWWITASSDEKARNSCTTGNPPSKLVVLKDIKSFWGYHVDYLKAAAGDGLRFVWLIRDVRGWVSSWLYAPKRQTNMYTSWKMHIADFYTKYYVSCDANNMMLGLPPHILGLMQKYRKFLAEKTQPSHLRMSALWTIETLVQHHMLEKHLPNDYFMLRYEDISRSPLEYSEKMFQFIGYPQLPNETRAYVQKTTSGGDPGDRYGAQRNSTDMITIWKSRLDPCQIKQIEIMAQPAASLFGYDLTPYNDKPVPITCKLDFLS